MNIIKDNREKLGLTMKELALRVGVSEATISRWESGNIKNMKRDKMFNLAKALKISPLELTDLSFDENEIVIDPKKDFINKICIKMADLSENDLEKLDKLIDTLFLNK